MTELMLTDFGTALGRASERFQVRRREQPAAEFAAEDVSHILVAGKGMALSADALALAAERGIPVTLLSFSGVPYARLATGNELDNAALRREQLYAANEPRGADIARTLIHGKLRNQAATLRYFAKSRKNTHADAGKLCRENANAIFALARSLKGMPENDMAAARNTILCVEAQAARHYWQAVAELLPENMHFPGRERRGATDPVNATLNYGYGILYARVWSAVARVRLDPYVGFLHTFQEGKPVLVFDLVEPFRPWLVDRPVLASITKKWRPQFDGNQSLTQDARKTIAARILNRFKQRFRYRRKMTRANDIIIAQAREIVAALQSNTPIKPFIAPW